MIKHDSKLMIRIIKSKNQRIFEICSKYGKYEMVIRKKMFI